MTTSMERAARESLDGTGAGDHDRRYVFGQMPRAVAPSPFSTRELARLMVLRSLIQAGLAGGDDGVGPR